MWSAPACIINMAWVERPLVVYYMLVSRKVLQTHTGGSPPKPAVFTEETAMAGLFFKPSFLQWQKGCEMCLV